MIVERSTAALVVVDTSGRVRFASNAARRLLGATGRDLVGQNLAGWCGGTEGSRLLLYLDQLGAGPQDRSAYIAVDVNHPDGAVRTVEVTGVNLVADRVVSGLVLHLVDVTGRARLEDQLARLATTDPLTGLANRRGLEEALGRAEGTLADGAVAEVAVCYLDLDRFKVINDTYGHSAGDHVLRELGQRLDDAVRGTDLVARIGGDEFFIVLHDPGDIAPVMERLLSAMAHPVTTDRGEVVVGASVGVTTMTAGVGWQEILRRADAALYRAKAAGRGCWASYDPELEQWLVARRAELQDLQAHYLELQASNAALEAALLTDARTELPNEVRADRDIDEAARRAEEEGEGFAVAFIDIDDFGRFNKRFGQHVGNAVLKAVAAALRGACRETDTVYRYGGEEFLALLPGATTAEALRVAERMRRQVEGSAHLAGGTVEPVTVSIGVARCDGRLRVEDIEVRQAADAAMRVAKESGKNRVALAPGHGGEPAAIDMDPANT